MRLPSRQTVRFIRKDLDDAVYKTKKEKFKAVVEEVPRKAHEKGTAGTGWYHYDRDFELLSKMLTKTGIPHKGIKCEVP